MSVKFFWVCFSILFVWIWNRRLNNIITIIISSHLSRTVFPTLLCPGVWCSFHHYHILHCNWLQRFHPKFFYPVWPGWLLDWWVDFLFIFVNDNNLDRGSWFSLENKTNFYQERKLQVLFFISCRCCTSAAPTSSSTCWQFPASTTSQTSQDSSELIRKPIYFTLASSSNSFKATKHGQLFFLKPQFFDN